MDRSRIMIGSGLSIAAVVGYSGAQAPSTVVAAKAVYHYKGGLDPKFAAEPGAEKPIETIPLYPTDRVVFTVSSARPQIVGRVVHIDVSYWTPGGKKKNDQERRNQPPLDVPARLFEHYWPRAAFEHTPAIPLFDLNKARLDFPAGTAGKLSLAPLGHNRGLVVGAPIAEAGMIADERQQYEELLESYRRMSVNRRLKVNQPPQVWQGHLAEIDVTVTIEVIRTVSTP